MSESIPNIPIPIPMPPESLSASSSTLSTDTIIPTTMGGKEEKKELQINDSSNDIDIIPLIPYSIYNGREKWLLVLLISTAGLFSPLSANIYFPAIPTISNDLGVSIESINLSVTFYMIFQGVSPTFWGAICDVLGRRPVYLVTFSIYILANIGLALTHVYWLLVVLRCVQAAGSASVIALGAGSIGDISSPKERGLYMAVFSLGPMLGPAIGPVFGGLLAEHAGWQSIFWFLTALALAVYVIMIVALPETLRSIVGNGSVSAQGINRNLISIIRIRKHRNDPIDPEVVKVQVDQLVKKTWKDIDFFSSFRLFAQKDVLLLLTFNSIIYTLFYCVITSTSTSLKTTYNLSETTIGICFLANGSGCLLASLLNGPRMNRDYRIVAEQVRVKKLVEGSENDEVEKEVKKEENDLSEFPIEHARLRSMPYFFIVAIASAITYGWTLEKAVNLSVPLICQFFLGLTITTQFNLVTTLMVDLFPGRSASATAANNFYRCLMGAGGTAVIDPILARMGPGWAFTMLSLITCCFVPLIVIEWKYGMGFRAERAEKDRLKSEFLKQT